MVIAMSARVRTFGSSIQNTPATKMTVSNPSLGESTPSWSPERSGHLVMSPRSLKSKQKDIRVLLLEELPTLFQMETLEWSQNRKNRNNRQNPKPGKRRRQPGGVHPNSGFSRFGPEKFRIVAVDCAKKRSADGFLCDYYGRSPLVEPTTVEHNAVSLKR